MTTSPEQPKCMYGDVKVVRCELDVSGRETDVTIRVLAVPPVEGYITASAPPAASLPGEVREALLEWLRP